MKLFEVLIEPEAPFGTPLKGDTLFGHFCWQAAMDQDLLDGGLEHWIERYDSQPFAVFSSAWPVIPEGESRSYAIARPPQLPEKQASVDTENRRRKLERQKIVKKLAWLLVDNDLTADLNPDRMRSDQDLFAVLERHLPKGTARGLENLNRRKRKPILFEAQAHNSISRMTMTTGPGPFAPYVQENMHYMPGIRLAVFVGAEESALSIDALRTGMERIGSWGYGRDASAGLGRFRLISVEERSWPMITGVHQACLSLGPVLPEKNTYSACYGTPFTRFGRHGDGLARSSHPFKKPVLMADDSSLLIPLERSVFDSPYIGTGVRNISVADQRTVMQGYSLYLPC